MRVTDKDLQEQVERIAELLGLPKPEQPSIDYSLHLSFAYGEVALDRYLSTGGAMRISTRMKSREMYNYLGGMLDCISLSRRQA